MAVTSQIATLKQHDLLPELEITLLDGATPVDLTFADAVTLYVSGPGGVKVEAAMTVADQTDPTSVGKVSYMWASADTDTPGVYRAEVKVTWDGGKVQTFPSDGYFTVRILHDLSAA